jgi:putative phage-type endonuclease
MSGKVKKNNRYIFFFGPHKFFFQLFTLSFFLPATKKETPNEVFFHAKMDFEFGDITDASLSNTFEFGDCQAVCGDDDIFVLTRAMQQSFVDTLAVSEDDVQRIMRYEQRSQEWFQARKGRMTGSIVGAIVGHNFFKKPNDLLRDLLWDTFNGNEATQWGTDHEAIAAVRYENHTNSDVDYPGLVINPKRPWLAYSPDGVVYSPQKLLLEIKCPFKKKVYPSIPAYYFDQIQYGAHLMECSVIDFFVWTPTKCKLERFAYERAYCEEFLIPSVERFYFRRFLPLYLLQGLGKLAEGSIQVPSNVVVEPFWPAE